MDFFLACLATTSHDLGAIVAVHLCHTKYLLDYFMYNVFFFFLTWYDQNRKLTVHQFCVYNEVCIQHMIAYNRVDLS